MKAKLLAAVAAMTFASLADATIISFATPIPVLADIDGVYIDFATGATNTTGAGNWDFNPYAANSGLAFYWGGDAGGQGGGVAINDVYVDLSAGSVVSASSAYSQAANDASFTVNFRPTGIHTLGFKFLNEGTGAINYGYARIQTTGPTGFPATVLGWSFDDTGAAITVAASGAVPEPATWAMMIAGFGLVGGAMRRRSTRIAFA